MKKSIFIILLTAGTLFLAGCQKDGQYGQNKSVRFSVGTIGTKTAYGATENNAADLPIWQSIDWTDGDEIRIYSDNAVRRVGYESNAAPENLYHWADYKVVPINTGTGRTNYSKASLENLIDDGNGLGNGLMWPNGVGDANFYAIYPKPSTTESAGTVDGASGTISYEIPAQQEADESGNPNMSYAYMLAKGNGSSSSQTVNLEFYPAFTAFEISIKADDRNTGAIALTSVTMQSSEATPLAGPVSAAVTNPAIESTFTVGSGASNSIAYTFPSGSVIPADGSDLTFTIFALPKQITGMTLEFTLGDGSTKTARLTQGDAAITFAACKKHRLYGIAMPEGDWPLYLIATTQKYDSFNNFNW